MHFHFCADEAKVLVLAVFFFWRISWRVLTSYTLARFSTRRNTH